MSNIIEFKPRLSKEDIKALNFSQDLDNVIVSAIKAGMPTTEVVGILANRLGAAIAAADKELNKETYNIFIDFVKRGQQDAKK